MPEKSPEELALSKLAKTVRKLLNRMMAGTGQERQAAEERLDAVLSRHKLTRIDIERMVHRAIEDEREEADEKQQQSADDEDETTPPQRPIPSAFELVDWVSRRFLYLDHHQHTALTLWILHTHVFRQFSHSPRLAALSPVRACGKSTLLDVCNKLCPRARKSGHISTATLPRLIDREQPILLLDEADNLDFEGDKILRSVLNDGFYEGGRRSILMQGQPTDFNLHSPVAFGAIGRLPLPLMSRSIIINMHRAPRTAKIERLDFKNLVLIEELDVVYRHVFDWAQQAHSQLNTDPEMPKGFYGRTADRWRALFSIADTVGRGKQARDAAKILGAERQDEDLKVTLLGDIYTAFAMHADDRMFTETLLQYLHATDDGNWAEPKPLTRSGLSKMLSPFGIRTKTIWPRFRTASSKSGRGYFRSQFEKAWGEYCGEVNTATHASNLRHLARP